MAEVVHHITLATANKIADEVLSQSRVLKLNPMVVIVLDAGGQVVVYKREDNSALLRFEVAYGKAFGSLGMGRPSRAFGQMATERPHFVNSLVGASGGRLIPVAGGVLIRNSEKRIIGAVGTSGDTSDNDELVAIKAIKSVGLISDPENAPA
jgi:uncharacterized protein GlcG (DUF336 family)